MYPAARAHSGRFSGYRSGSGVGVFIVRPRFADKKVAMDRATADAVNIRDLKRRYKMGLATGANLPTHDIPISLPLSTGNPLFDAALTDKLVVTATLSEAEHLNRGWKLVQGATNDERDALARNARLLLNDYKLLLALRAWQEGNEAQTRMFLRALPWAWRLAFPTAVIKPAAQVFTGWRRSLRFRLVDDPRYGAFHELYREILAQAPPITLLKYRRTVHEATALLHYRFEGDRERAIHDWCYGDGTYAATVREVEPIGIYLRARRALAADGPAAFLDILNNAAQAIPITSYMGLLGSSGISLTDKRQSSVEGLRDYAIRSATAVESLLRLAEWGDWLTKGHAAVLSEKVRTGIIESGVDIPFFKVTKAFMAAPDRVRRMVLEPLYLPLLRHFGQQTTALLPPPGPLTFVQPANYLHLMSFLLYATLSSATPTRLLLLDKKGVEEVDPLPLDAVGKHLADSPHELERWLLSEFGGLATQYDWTYNWNAIGDTLRGLDPKAPLLLDLPFADNLDILEALLPFERVFNLSGAYGAPGEVCLSYQYYAKLFIGTERWSYSVWTRYSDSAAQSFAEFMDRLAAFQTLAAEADTLTAKGGDA
jgi:hypothetical protein